MLNRADEVFVITPSPAPIHVFAPYVLLPLREVSRGMRTSSCRCHGVSTQSGGLRGSWWAWQAQTREERHASDVSISQLQHSVLFSSSFDRFIKKKKKVKSFCTLIQMAAYNFKHLIVILWRFSSSSSESLLIWVMPSEMRIRAIWNSDATLDDQPRLCLLIQEGSFFTSDCLWESTQRVTDEQRKTINQHIR